MIKLETITDALNFLAELDGHGLIEVDEELEVQKLRTLDLIDDYKDNDGMLCECEHEYDYHNGLKECTEPSCKCNGFYAKQYKQCFDCGTTKGVMNRIVGKNHLIDLCNNCMSAN